MTALRKELWHALWDVGLFPVPDLFTRCTAEIEAQGMSESARLAELLGPPIWSDLIAAWGRSNVETLSVYQLGSGRMQTEFVLAPLMLPEDLREAVVHLGAIGNLIVALYDDLVDDAQERDLLARSDLLDAITGRGESSSVLTSNKPSVSQALGQLVALYFTELAALPCFEGRSSIFKLLNRSILLMYDAESQTLSGSSSAQIKRAIRRKSAIPAVVMGLPGWLVSPHYRPALYAWHLRWLYAFGDFCGLVDDALDLEDDARTGHPNFIQFWIDDNIVDTAESARRIASYGMRLRADWESHIPSGFRAPLVAEMMSTCIGLAFGGSAQHHKERR